MKITIYTITSCQFSKQEKDYLTAHQLSFEEKNLETNREFLTEMLTISNNFAGTPVTKIEKDDGQIAVLKGFTKEEFDKTLGITDTKPQQEASQSPAPIPQEPQPTVPEQPAQPVQNTVPQAPTPQANPAPAQPDPMADVLNTLAQQAVSPTPDAPAQNPTPPTPATPPMPNIPDPKL